MAINSKEPKVVSDIDWGEFLARHDMTWVVRPISWDEGAFLGNGLIGAMMYGEEHRSKRHVLRFVMGRTDITAYKPGRSGYPPRVPIGEFDLEMEGMIYQPVEIRLDLWNAELRARYATTKGEARFRAFVHGSCNTMAIELETSEEERDAQIRWYPYPEVDAVLKNADGINLNQYIPDTQVRRLEIDGVQIGVQSYPEGEGCATAWKEIRLTDKRRICFITVSKGGDEQACREAADEVNRAASEPWDVWVSSHREWWHNYYRQSFVSIPDTQLEGFYWIQMYKLASATRAEYQIIDNQGPWLAPTPWAGVWFNMNVQMSYSPVYTANRLDLGVSLIRGIERNMEQLIRNVPEPYRHDSAGLGRSCSYNLNSKVGTETGNLTWVCHNLWRHYRHSMDDGLLSSLLYPLLRRSVNYYLHILEQGEDGKLHLPPSISPEYGSFKQLTVEDCHYDLALLRWGLMTLKQICRRLDIKDEQEERWKEVLADLTPLPTDDTGFMVGAGTPLAFGHRHFSHLLAVFPLHIVHGEDAPEERALIERSFKHWLGNEGDLRGFSFTGAASIAASLGWGDFALRCVRTLLHLIKPNTMYKEAGPVMESPLAGAESIQDMLLQSWGGRIRVFPAVPEAWPEALFHDLRTEGAFLVSARRANGKTVWIRIRSLAGEPCRLQTGWTGDTVIVGERAIRKQSMADGVLVIDLAAGEEVVLYPADEPQTSADFTVRPVAAQPHLKNIFGGHKPWRLYGLTLPE